ncbi:hypothetical protein MRB53_041478 [Persea americana]|nr:hypothetical protein MRB53_041478 [Persea americana]
MRPVNAAPAFGFSFGSQPHESQPQSTKDQNAEDARARKRRKLDDLNTSRRTNHKNGCHENGNAQQATEGRTCNETSQAPETATARSPSRLQENDNVLRISNAKGIKRVGTAKRGKACDGGMVQVEKDFLKRLDEKKVETKNPGSAVYESDVAAKQSHQGRRKALEPRTTRRAEVTSLTTDKGEDAIIEDGVSSGVHSKRSGMKAVVGYSKMPEENVQHDQEMPEGQTTRRCSPSASRKKLPREKSGVTTGGRKHQSHVEEAILGEAQKDRCISPSRLRYARPTPTESNSMPRRKSVTVQTSKMPVAETRVSPPRNASPSRPLRDDNDSRLSSLHAAPGETVEAARIRVAGRSDRALRRERKSIRILPDLVTTLEPAEIPVKHLGPQNIASQQTGYKLELPRRRKPIVDENSIDATRVNKTSRRKGKTLISDQDGIYDDQHEASLHPSLNPFDRQPSRATVSKRAPDVTETKPAKAISVNPTDISRRRTRKSQTGSGNCNHESNVGQTKPTKGGRTYCNAALNSRPADGAFTESDSGGIDWLFDQQPRKLAMPVRQRSANARSKACKPRGTNPHLLEMDLDELLSNIASLAEILIDLEKTTPKPSAKALTMHLVARLSSERIITSMLEGDSAALRCPSSEHVGIWASALAFERVPFLLVTMHRLRTTTPQHVPGGGQESGRSVIEMQSYLKQSRHCNRSPVGGRAWGDTSAQQGTQIRY